MGCSAPNFGEVVGDGGGVVEGGDGADVAIRSDHDPTTVLEPEALCHNAFRVGDDGVVPVDRGVVTGHQHLRLTGTARGGGHLSGGDGEYDVADVVRAVRSA